MSRRGQSLIPRGQTFREQFLSCLRPCRPLTYCRIGSNYFAPLHTSDQDFMMGASRRDVLWSSAFRFLRPVLWCGQARLYTDRLELRGWSWRGRYRRLIELQRIVHVDVLATDEVRLWCSGGDTFRLRLDDAAEWKKRLLRQQAILEARRRVDDYSSG